MKDQYVLISIAMMNMKKKGEKSCVVPATLTSATVAVVLLTIITPTQSKTPSPTPIQYSIFEEVQIGTHIGSLIEDADLTSKFANNSGTTLEQLRFKMLNYPEPLQIEVDDRTGLLRTVSRLDREASCPQMIDCALSYDIAIQPMAYFQIIKVVVRILDINDNAPTFPLQYQSVEISETSALRSTFSLSSAYDPDSPNFGVRRYRLHPPHHPIFELDFALSTLAGVPDVVRLVLIGQLDYESVMSYQLELVAIDGGDPSKSSRLPLDIVIVDDNDNMPRFDNATYEKYIMENVVVGSTIDRVKASDADSGLNGAVSFSFDSKTQQQHGDTFSIDSSTGSLVLRSNLNYEKTSRYVLGIVATDGGSIPHTSFAQYAINIQDVNDNAPEIRFNTLTASGLAEVPENSEVGHFVAHVTVTDLDIGDAGKVTCSLSNDDFNLIRLFNMEYKIVTSRAFDHEHQSHIDVMVTCRDHGWQQLKSSVKIPVFGLVNATLRNH